MSKIAPWPLKLYNLTVGGMGRKSPAYQHRRPRKKTLLGAKSLVVLEGKEHRPSLVTLLRQIFETTAMRRTVAVRLPAPSR